RFQGPREPRPPTRTQTQAAAWTRTWPSEARKRRATQALQSKRRAAPTSERPSFFTGPEGGVRGTRKKLRRPTEGGNLAARRAARLLLPRSNPVQSFLVAKDQQAALVGEQAVPLHLVDQGR